jgi:penicillin-binding protein 1C
MHRPSFTASHLAAALIVASCMQPSLAFAAGAVSFDEVKRGFRSSDTAVLDRNGEPLQRVRTDATVRRGQWIALADVSPALRMAMVLSEDRRFYEHSGIDWRAVSSAAWANLWNTRTRGASTITMQLSGLLDEDLRRANSGRTFTQKIGQTVAATQLERNWRKDQILEAYLNTVPFRGEIVGIDALSRTLFGKAPSGLDAREAAVAAALVRAPNAKPAQVAQRACEVMRAMEPGQKIDCDALDMFTSAAVQRRAFDANEGIAPHAARRVLKELGEAEATAKSAAPARQASPRETAVRTTLRAPLQRFALDALQRHLKELRGRHVEDGALVVLDNASGEVLAWVGSSGPLSQAAEVDAVTALRQPGSTLKPLLYAQAIAERRLTAASLIDDSSAQINTASGLYIPQNYDRQFKGPVSARTALAASLNVPAVRTLVMVSPEAFARQLRAAGLPLRESGDYYGYSLALGSAEVSLLSLTNAYRMLANGGRYGTTTLTARTAAPPPASSAKPRAADNTSAAVAPMLDPAAAFIVGDILSDANARTRTFGLDSILSTRFWTAVKTGTSKDMRDNWAVGWSQRYTVGVWVGNASGASMWDVSGTSGAAPVWAEVMRFLHAREPSRAPRPPAGLVEARVAFGPGADGNPLEAARSEWFLQGTEQPLFALDAGAGTPSANTAAARIIAPVDGTIIALDPDIPPLHQRVRFESEGRGVQWRIDGKHFARGNSAQWLPWPGRHVIELVDATGKVVDQRRLEVRGAGVVAKSARR